MLYNPREEAIKEAKGLERWKLKLGLTEIPDLYVCRTIQEFKQNRDSIPNSRLAIIPKLAYFPNPKSDEEIIYLPFTLHDNGDEIFVWVRPMAVMKDKTVVECLLDLNQGNIMEYAIVRNGLPPEIASSREDFNRLYLVDFLSPRITKRSPSRLKADIELSDFIPDALIPGLITVRR